MQLDALSNFIKVDELSNNHEINFVHFLTRLELYDVSETWSAIIYTSCIIAHTLNKSIKKISLDKFQIMEPDITYEIKLPNDAILKATLINTESISGNVMFLFKLYDDVEFLYTGNYTAYHKVLQNDFIHNSTKNGCIETIYLDNTLVTSPSVSTHHLSLVDACERVKMIIQKYPKHRIRIGLPPLGYEDLIIGLATNCNRKVAVGSLRYILFRQQNLLQNIQNNTDGAHIIIEPQKNISHDQLYKRFQDGFLTVNFSMQLSRTLTEYLTSTHQGTYEIHYAPHPTYMDLYALVTYVQPKYIYGINLEYGNIPTYFTQMFRKEKIVQDSNTDTNEMSGHGERLSLNTHRAGSMFWEATVSETFLDTSEQ